jgi:hypothetical protein
VRGPTKRTALVSDALKIVREILDRMPTSEEAQRLLERALALEAQTHAWVDTPPTDDEREHTMRKALALHIAAAKLNREIPK